MKPNCAARAWARAASGRWWCIPPAWPVCPSRRRCRVRRWRGAGTRRWRRPAGRSAAWPRWRTGGGRDRGRGGRDRGRSTRAGRAAIADSESPRHHRRHLHAAGPRRPRRRAPLRPGRARDRRTHPALSRARRPGSPGPPQLAELPDAEGHAVDQVVVTFFAAPALLHRRRRGRDLLPRLAGRAAPLRRARAARPARAWPSPANSPCAPISTAASICRRPKPSAI